MTPSLAGKSLATTQVASIKGLFGRRGKVANFPSSYED